jgi:hypothetical protein
MHGVILILVMVVDIVVTVLRVGVPHNAANFVAVNLIHVSQALIVLIWLMAAVTFQVVVTE